MRRFGHAMFHVGAVALQVVVAASPFIPPPFNIATAGGIAAIQGIVALRHHPKPQTTT